MANADQNNVPLAMLIGEPEVIEVVVQNVSEDKNKIRNQFMTESDAFAQKLNKISEKVDILPYPDDIGVKLLQSRAASIVYAVLKLKYPNGDTRELRIIDYENLFCEDVAYHLTGDVHGLYDFLMDYHE